MWRQGGKSRCSDATAPRPVATHAIIPQRHPAASKRARWLLWVTATQLTKAGAEATRGNARGRSSADPVLPRNLSFVEMICDDRNIIAGGSWKRAGIRPGRLGPMCLLALTLNCTDSPTGGDPGDPNVLIRDTFSRVQREGWGVADVGGRWYMNVNGPIFRVDGNTGIIELPNNAGPQNVVGRGSGGYGLDVVGLISFSVDRAPDGPRETHHVQ